MGYLITNGKVLDGTGRPPFAGAVRVEGNRIAEVIAGLPTPGRRCGASSIATCGAGRRGS